MKKLVPVVIIMALIASCGSKEEAKSNSATQATVDSLVGERMNDLVMQAMEDRDRRISIEVKPKADSIVNAWKAANGMQ